MSRALRIEYPNAIYHVMNRGRGRQSLFHGRPYTDAFIESITEAHQQFEIEVLAYCLMGNHYHLLLRTPRGNLSRGMRHINGVYTQRYNKLRKTDGALFRGRYKAILVEKESYLLPVSRYIHRNPIETKNPLVNKLEDYFLSSYPAYINSIESNKWLRRDLILSFFGMENPYLAYQRYVDMENSEEINSFYNKEKPSTVMGSKNFSEQIKCHALSTNAEVSGAFSTNTIVTSQIVECVANHFCCQIEDITSSQSKLRKNTPRRIAMYLAQQLMGASLSEIASHFNVGSYSTVSATISRLKKDAQANQELLNKIKKLKLELELMS